MIFIDYLLKELLHRWELAFDEVEKLSQYKAQVKTIQYADNLRYNLNDFEWNDFPSGGPLTTEKGDGAHRLDHEYGFNDKGLPCYMVVGHDYHHIKWAGFYRYTEDLVEYVEFCLPTGVPSALVRIEYQDGRKKSFQSMFVNARGSAPVFSSMSREAIINAVRTDKYSLISTVKQFKYDENGKIEKAYCLHVAPGIGTYSSHDEYTYGPDDQVHTIRTFFEQGSNRLTYCRIPENTTADALIHDLATEMARAIASALADDEDIEQPVALLQLSYHYADDYHPYPFVRSAREVAEKLEEGDFSFLHLNFDSVNVDIKPFETLFAQMEQMMEERKDMKIGRTMWRKTAALLTKNKLFNKVAITDDFAAYAIDWTVEGHSDEDFEEILKECGVDTGHLEIWRQKGMLPLHS